MKTEGYLFVILAVFFAIVTPIYWYMSGDPTGTTALTLSFGLAFLVAFYLLFTARRMAPRPALIQGPAEVVRSEPEA